MGLILLEGEGLCVSGQNGCICDDRLWILDEDDGGFLNLFYFLCFSFLASAVVTPHWFIIGREWCRRHYAVNHLWSSATTADVGYEFAILRGNLRTWIHFLSPHLATLCSAKSLSRAGLMRPAPLDCLY